MLRTLLYVTTHLSEWHTSGLRCLWPAAARRARLLRDAVVFNSGRPATAAQLAAVAAAFPRYNNRSVEIFSAEATRQVHRKAFTLGSTKKQMGAILALSEAEARGWFDGYDWVVRLNPDVIVSEDRFLRTHMARDGIDAVLAFCGRSSPSGTSTSRVHTDFMAWRPATLPGIFTPSSRRSYGDNIASMAWGARNLISTQDITARPVRAAAERDDRLRPAGRDGM
tara:strand:+ start:316 stop:987 length:672 start_codon:yes stop_codon:yes gene_type:complete